MNQLRQINPNERLRQLYPDDVPKTPLSGSHGAHAGWQPAGRVRDAMGLRDPVPGDELSDEEWLRSIAEGRFSGSEEGTSK